MTSFVETATCDLLVIGSGIAGCTAALKAAEGGRKVVVLSASRDPRECNSFWAQGGIIYKATNDRPDLLESDVHRAGAGLCNAGAVAKLAHEGPSCVEEFLLSDQMAPVPFDRAGDGSLALCLEGSHNRARILHWHDETGKAIMESLIRAVLAHENIDVLAGHTAVDLVLDVAGACVGATVLDTPSSTGPAAPLGTPKAVQATATVLATGGCGEVYEHTSNPPEARGDGLAMAIRAGAKLGNMEYMQFHPTTLYVPGERRFLLTEALRGEGARLLSPDDRRAFAREHHPDGELAPRDVVARMILAEMHRCGAEHVYLDISHKDSDWLKARFPSIYQHCLSRGIDMTSEPIPVVPAAHYFCGGVAVDLSGRTSVPGLYAAGEVSCTGVHGANRLASTSLLEGLVWGNAVAVESQAVAVAASTAAAIATATATAPADGPTTTGPTTPVPTAAPAAAAVADEDATSATAAPAAAPVEPAELAELRARVQRTMWRSVGILRQPDVMRAAVTELDDIMQQLEAMRTRHALSMDLLGSLNLATVAADIARAASQNSVSAGCHRVQTDDDQAPLAPAQAE